MRGRLRARADRGRRFSLADHREHVCTVAEALGDAFGVGAEEHRSLQARVRIPSAPDGSAWAGGQYILHLIGAVVLLRRPAVVVETGVAMGFTTAVILAAMDENGAGTLESIDLPPLQVDATGFVGNVIPVDLRGRWTLHVGRLASCCLDWSASCLRLTSLSTTATTATLVKLRNTAKFGRTWSVVQA